MAAFSLPLSSSSVLRQEPQGSAAHRPCILYYVPYGKASIIIIHYTMYGAIGFAKCTAMQPATGSRRALEAYDTFDRSSRAAA